MEKIFFFNSVKLMTLRPNKNCLFEYLNSLVKKEAQVEICTSSLYVCQFYSCVAA